MIAGLNAILTNLIPDAGGAASAGLLPLCWQGRGRRGTVAVAAAAQLVKGHDKRQAGRLADRLVCLPVAMCNIMGQAAALAAGLLNPPGGAGTTTKGLSTGLRAPASVSVKSENLG